MKSSQSRGDRWRSLGRDCAAEIAEAAVILPALFMLLLSIYWFGRAYTVYGAINQAARAGAQTAAVPACANCNGGCTWPGSSLPCDKIVWDEVTDTLLAANLDPSKMIPSTPNPTPQPCPNVVPEGVCAKVSGGQFTICRNVVLNQGASSPPVCGEIISFQYPYQFILPFTSLNNQRILLKAQVEMRGED
jgi:hypothetical protein